LNVGEVEAVGDLAGAQQMLLVEEAVEVLTPEPQQLQ
jgi:hypothetical protein